MNVGKKGTLIIKAVAGEPSHRMSIGGLSGKTMGNDSGFHIALLLWCMVGLVERTQGVERSQDFWG